MDIDEPCIQLASACRSRSGGSRDDRAVERAMGGKRSTACAQPGSDCNLRDACAEAHRALKVQTKSNAADSELERVVALMDNLFAIDREARDEFGGASLDAATNERFYAARHALRQERAPAWLGELQALLLKMKARVLPKSIAGKAVAYTLARWQKLTRFMEHPISELSTNWAENAMRGIALGRKNWMQIGSKEAGPKIAALFSIVESGRKLGVPIRKYLASGLPGLADRSIRSLAELTPAAYAAHLAK